MSSPDMITAILFLVAHHAPALAANPRYRAFLQAQHPGRLAMILDRTRTYLGCRTASL